MMKQIPHRSWLLALDHVQLAIPAGGEDRSREFWVGLMGLTEVAKPPALATRGGAWFEAPGVVVHVGVEADFVPAAKAHPAFRARHLDALAAHLANAGFPVRWDDEIPGTRRFHTVDPFGNRLEIISS